MIDLVASIRMAAQKYAKEEAIRNHGGNVEAYNSILAAYYSGCSQVTDFLCRNDGSEEVHPNSLYAACVKAASLDGFSIVK
jgi:hypothetical protein